MLPVERTTGLGCIREGRTVSYECTVNDNSGGSITVWRGNAFNCSEMQINLFHDARFGPTFDHCGTLLATIVNINNSEYTSQLNLTATADINGATLMCTVSGNNQEEFNDTISVGGIYGHSYLTCISMLLRSASLSPWPTVCHPLFPQFITHCQLDPAP